MKKKFNRTVIYLFFIYFFGGCGANYNFKKAEQLKEKGYYIKAIKRYERIVAKFVDTEFAATAQYTIGNIYFYKLKNYEIAQQEFQSFLNIFPKDKRVAQVKYMIGIITYKYNTTDSKIDGSKKAIKIFKDIIEEYKNTEWEKVARKRTSEILDPYVSKYLDVSKCLERRQFQEAIEKITNFPEIAEYIQYIPAEIINKIPEKHYKQFALEILQTFDGNPKNISFKKFIKDHFYGIMGIRKQVVNIENQVSESLGRRNYLSVETVDKWETETIIPKQVYEIRYIGYMEREGILTKRTQRAIFQVEVWSKKIIPVDTDAFALLYGMQFNDFWEGLGYALKDPYLGPLVNEASKLPE